MAYITKYNLSQLCQKLEIKDEINLETFLEYIYNDKEIYFILNKREIEYLFVYRMILHDEKQFVVEYYKEVPEKEDTKTRVFNKGGKMKYHLSSNCKLLKKDYLDFNIPAEIKEISKKNKNDEAIEEYRDWFTKNNFAERYKNGEIDGNFIIREFNLKYPAKYGIKRIEDNSNLLIFEAKNSNNEFQNQSFNFEDFKKELQEAKLQWQNTFQSKVARTFAKFKYLSDKSDAEITQKMSEIFSPEFTQNYGIKNLREKFELSKKHTYKIINLILNYIKWTYKLDTKEFDNLTLEKFGLECCHSCKNEQINKPVN
jgi:hypothetical protein